MSEHSVRHGQVWSGKGAMQGRRIEITAAPDHRDIVRYRVLDTGRAGPRSRADGRLRVSSLLAGYRPEPGAGSPLPWMKAGHRRRRCHICGRSPVVRGDGTLSAHKVAPGRTEPCAGAGQTPRATAEGTIQTREDLADALADLMPAEAVDEAVELAHRYGEALITMLWQSRAWQEAGGPG